MGIFRFFRSIPSPFAGTYLLTGLINERIQKRKASKYADRVVRHYSITFEEHLEEIKNKQAHDRYLSDMLLYGTDEEKREALRKMNENDTK